MSQPWNPNVPPKGRVLATYAGFAGAIGFVIAAAAPWPWKLVAAVPFAGCVALGVAAWKAAREFVRSWGDGEFPVDVGSNSSLRRMDRYRTRVARLTAAVTGTAFVGMSVIASVDYIESHQRTHERATVIAEHRLSSSSCANGHSMMAEYSVTWRSENPPAGLPAEFTQSESCKLYRVGHADTIVRRRGANGSVRVEVSPFDSVVDELVLVAGGTLLSVPIGLFWAMWRLTKKSKTNLDRTASSGT